MGLQSGPCLQPPMQSAFWLYSLKLWTGEGVMLILWSSQLLMLPVMLFAMRGCRVFRDLWSAELVVHNLWSVSNNTGQQIACGFCPYGRRKENGLFRQCVPPSMSFCQSCLVAELSRMSLSLFCRLSGRGSIFHLVFWVKTGSWKDFEIYVRYLQRKWLQRIACFDHFEWNIPDRLTVIIRIHLPPKKIL